MLPDYNDILKRLEHLKAVQVESLIAADHDSRHDFIRGRVHGLTMAISAIEDERNKIEGGAERQISNAPAARYLSSALTSRGRFS